MEKRFRALRVTATIYKIFAWLILVLGILVALYLFVIMLMVGASVGSRDPSGLIGGGVAGVFAGIAALIYGSVLFLVLYGAGEAIFLALAIEENTRESALLMRYPQRGT